MLITALHFAILFVVWYYFVLPGPHPYNFAVFRVRGAAGLPSGGCGDFSHPGGCVLSVSVVTTTHCVIVKSVLVHRVQVLRRGLYAVVPVA